MAKLMFNHGVVTEKYYEKKFKTTVQAIEKAREMIPDVIVEDGGSHPVWQLNRYVKTYNLYQPNADWKGISPGKKPIGNIYV